MSAWLEEVWAILCMSGPYLIVGFFLAGLLKVLIPERWILRHLGKDDLSSVVKASLFGAPIPLCSCSVVPTAVSLKRAGASKGATSSFLISTPETGVDSVGITLALIDPLMTLARPIAAVATALGCGSAVNLLVRRGWDGEDPAPGTSASVPGTSDGESCCDAPAPEPISCCEQDQGPIPEPASCSEPSPPPAVESRLARALSFAYGKLMSDLTPAFVIGFALSGVISLLLPAEFLGEHLVGFSAMLVMLVAGAPLYVCATASTPIAAALMAKGLDPGAALVFLLAGPATNAATMGVVGSFLGRRVLVVYLVTIASLSLLAGLLVHALYPVFGYDPRAVATAALHEHLGAIDRVGGAVLLALLAYHSYLLVRQRLNRGAPAPS